MKDLRLPDVFNVATHFVDRHLSEGRDAKAAFECGDDRVTYRQLFENVNQAGNAFRKLGVRDEERVALLLLDTPDFAYCFFGAIKIGAVAVPMNTMLSSAEYEYMLNDCRARVVVVSETLLPKVQEIPKENLRYLEKIVVSGPASGDDPLFQLLSGSSRELVAR